MDHQAHAVPPREKRTSLERLSTQIRRRRHDVTRHALGGHSAVLTLPAQELSHYRSSDSLSGCVLGPRLMAVPEAHEILIRAWFRPMLLSRAPPVATLGVYGERLSSQV